MGRFNSRLCYLFQLLKSQIVQEYVKNKQDPRYLEATKAFSYLHGKLSHVKRLVHDYDTQHGLANQSRPQQREA
jgi:RNA polymerase II elongation factor ELL